MLGMDSIRIMPETLLSACEVDEFKGLWNALDKHTTGLNLLGDVAGHGNNFKQVLGPLKDQAITVDIIRILHALQMGGRGVSPFKTESNQLEIANSSGPSGFLETAAPEQVEKLLSKLVTWLNKTMEAGEQHPLITIAGFTSVFLQLSPFQEGNLKTARFLILLLMLKSGYAYAPYLPLDKIMTEEGGAIFRGLRHNQESLENGTPDWSMWLRAFFIVLRTQKEQLEKRINEKEKDLSHLPTLSGRIMKLFEEHQRLQINQIIKLTKGRRSTVKLRLGELVEAGYLKRYGQARSTWYSLA
jgi:Fic family protein